MKEENTITYDMFTFRSKDGKITASAQRDSQGDLLVTMKPHDAYTEEEMYELFKSMGFEETLTPLKGLVKPG